MAKSYVIIIIIIIGKSGLDSLILKKISKYNSKFYQLDLSSFIKKYLKVHGFFYKSDNYIMK